MNTPTTSPAESAGHGGALAWVSRTLTILLGLVWIFPLYWAINTSLMAEPNTVMRPPSFIPQPPTLEEFDFIINHSQIIRWYFNSVVTTLAVVVFVLLLSLMSAYALSQVRFRGKKALYIFILAGFMIPYATNVVPLYMLMVRLKMSNTYWGIILPQLVNPIAVVIYKQFFDQMPQELSDAAKIDGAGDFRVLFRIFLPLNLAITWALAIILFIWTWNNFFWPWIIENTTEMMTIPVGLPKVQSAYGVHFARDMAAAVLAGIPTVVLYLVFQRRVAQGVAITSGIK
jgi:multiple sugar transport system permease protein